MTLASTITEKILANAAGVERVTPGEIITAKVDAVIGHDNTTAAFRELEKMKVNKVFDRSKVYFTVDHFVPSPTIEAATQLRDLGVYIKKYGIEHWFEQGRGGVCHAIFPEAGLVRPGMVIVGSDSHTCTYGALSAFASGLGTTDVAAAMALGELWLKVPASLRFVFEGKLRPMVTGKDLILYTIGQIGVDGALYKAMEFTGEHDPHAAHRRALHDLQHGYRSRGEERHHRARRDHHEIPGRQYAGAVREIRQRSGCGLRGRVPLGRLDYRAAGGAAVPAVQRCARKRGEERQSRSGRHRELHERTDQRSSRRRPASSRERRPRRGVRLLVFPATQQIYLEAMREGLLEIFVEAGAMISPPICGPCLGGHMGLLAEGEVAITTTNRNFVSRMGHKNSKVYLASPYTAAAAAVAGYIIDPRQVS